MTVIRNIIFDLDGTLIDSAPAILAGFRSAFQSCDLSPKVALDASIVGPSLQETLSYLAGTDEQSVIDCLSSAFKSDYDEVGYRESAVYPGIPQMLQALKENGFDLYIATNKRHDPTQKIIKFLEWQGFFNAVYSLDSSNPSLSNKAELISRIIEKHQLDLSITTYIGDRSEDNHAASVNAMACILVEWGYGELVKDGTVPRAKSPSKLTELLST